MFRALLLDDERPQREGMARHVKWADYCFEEPVLCANGWDALEQLKKQEIHLLITDIRMPGMDGLQVMAQARKIMPELSIVVVSGYAEFHYAQEALHNGAREYLLKPVKPEDIHRLLADFVSAHARGGADGDEGDPRGLIEEITALLTDNVSTGISLEEIAAQVHMNPSYMCTVFKKSCGETIFERLARLQREQACMLLATTSRSISDIAACTGGRTASNFTQWFRKKVGITPLEYRRLTQKEQ